MTKPLVSVIIVTIGRPELIPRAIQSVLNQTYVNFELIIGDVSGKNETKAIVSEYPDPRIRYIKIEHEIDPAKTINGLITGSGGEFIAFCDDDDEWISDAKLQKQVDLINQLGGEYGIIYNWYEVWDDGKDELIELRKPVAEGDIFLKMLGDNVMAGTPNLLIRKSLFDTYGGWIEGTIYTTDHLMLTKLSQSTKVSYVPEILVRVHHNHMYGRQTNLEMSRFSRENRIRYQKEFLNRFDNQYQAHPAAKLHHFQIIISDAIALGDFKLAFSYLFQSIAIRPLDKSIYKSSARMLLSMLRRVFQAQAKSSIKFKI
jgi:glycosyltransferase involved in cell wall biosynthesis